MFVWSVVGGGRRSGKVYNGEEEGTGEIAGSENWFITIRLCDRSAVLSAQQKRQDFCSQAP